MRILTSTFLYSFLLLSFTTNAQISIGIKGGLDFSKLVNAVQGNDGSGGISTLSSGTVNQLYGGVFVDIPLDSGKKMFYIRPGIEYIGAGGNMNSTGDYSNPNGFTPSTKYTLHYVDVPVEFVYSPRFDWGRPLVGFGFYGGELVNGTIKTQGAPSTSVKIGSNSTDNFQRTDVGYTFTIGLITHAGFLFGVDYQHGFTKVIPDGVQQTRNAVWGLHVGWLVKL